MITPGDTVGVGLSGGADSVALTHFLFVNKEKLGIKKIVAVHLNHGIRGAEAYRDEKFAEQFCKSLGIEFLKFSADIPKESEKTGESIEECARRIRYACFEKANCDKFATAHNLNDNAETVIFNLARGSSVSGICGIPYVRNNYIRPLLDCTRAEIEKYIAENNLEYVVDSTNLCDDYTRNKIRRNILPILFEINPAFDKSFLRCISSLKSSADYIDEVSQNILEKTKCDRGYDCSVFENTHDAVRLNVIHKILISENIGNVSREHIISVDKIIRNGGSVSLPGGKNINSEQKILFFGKIDEPEYFERKTETECSEPIITPIGTFKIFVNIKKDLQILNKEVLEDSIDCDKISGDLILRNRKDGDSVKLRRRKVTKSLKKLFNEAKIPVSARKRLLILADSEGIVWIEGFGVCERCKINEKTEKSIMLKRVGDNND